MPLKKTPVPQSELRRLFNTYYLESFQRGDLTKVIESSRRPSAHSNQAIDVKSEIWRLYNRNGDYIAAVHTYVKPDGTLAASGKPDPKEVIIGQNRYVLLEIPK